ncbi:MAG TPA: TauD/TfdA family dioxygenase, partial [Pyrinomonadaceae bacterium]
FNHLAFYHISSLSPEVRESLLSQFAESDLPFNTYYGDGSTIEERVVEEIREAYRQEVVEFPWQEGDILLVDNMLVAHGRKPFTGPRRILVTMGEAIDRSEVQAHEAVNENAELDAARALDRGRAAERAGNNRHV